MDSIKFWSGTSITSIAIVFFIVSVIRLITLSLNPNVVVYKNGSFIYEGNKTCITVRTSGDSTQIDIHGGFLCFFPDRYISGKNIEIETK